MSKKVRPMKVDILGKDFSIWFLDPEDEYPLHEQSYSGRTDDDRQQIIIDNRQNGDQKRDTVIHEILHSIDKQLKLDLSEAQIFRLACGLYQVFKANPKLVNWILKNETSKL